ncbi:MAG: hypothetical protein MUQ26_06635, partial [Armatimonadetes bacterium]|nr:hypothetical protein [Armatimonadota bacterium]
MRICILTNGNFFANLILRRLFAERPEQIAGIVLSTKIYQGRSRLAALRAVWRRVGPVYFWYKASTYGLFMAAGAAFRRTPFFVPQLAARHGVPVVPAQDVNAPSVVAQVNAWQPDVVLSVSCNQLIGPGILAAAGRIALNAHSSLLPRYAGLAPYVWVLANGERETGI